MKQDYEMLYRDLCERTLVLLNKQQEYFRTRDKNVLADCKKREKELREECYEIVHGKRPKITTGQTSLPFDVKPTDFL